MKKLFCLCFLVSNFISFSQESDKMNIRTEIEKDITNPLEIDNFSQIPKEFQNVNYLMYSENQESFKLKKYKVFENLEDNTVLLYIDSKPFYLKLTEYESKSESDMPDKYFTNNQLTLKISRINPIEGGDEITFIYRAEITIINNLGQIINFSVYGKNDVN